jgi:protein KRI1
MARPKSAKQKAARALTDPNNANNAPLGERPAKKAKLDDEPPAKKAKLDDEPPAKKAKLDDEPPAKKAKLLDHSDDEPDSDQEGGISLKVNEEYAKRYEFNNKRAEKHRCKYCI